MTRIGLFGGTFDPPHLGHMILAAEAFHSLSLDRIFWILTPQSPLKDERTISSVQQRRELVLAALQNVPEFELSQVDILRDPPYYAVDTVKILKREYPGTDFIYLMGGDSLRDLPAWHDPNQFVQELSGLGVYRRPGSQPDLEILEKLCPGIKTKTTIFQAPQIEISAADIRQRIREGRPFRFFLPPEVYQLICAQNLYR